MSSETSDERAMGTLICVEGVLQQAVDRAVKAHMARKEAAALAGCVECKCPIVVGGKPLPGATLIEYAHSDRVEAMCGKCVKRIYGGS